jgi:hypothetical protein
MASGRDIIVEARLADSVYDVKCLLFNLESIPTGQQRLILGGTELDDWRSLLSYGIRAEVVVHLVVRPAVSLGDSGRSRF